MLQHRGLMGDLLTPLNFNVVEAPDAESCLNMVKQFSPDLFLIDRQMPGMHGPKLAHVLRLAGFTVPIIMVTANANEDTLDPSDGDFYSSKENNAYDDYLTKPIQLSSLFQSIGNYLAIDWVYDSSNLEPAEINPHQKKHKPVGKTKLSEEVSKKILALVEIGHLSELKFLAEQLNDDKDVEDHFIDDFKRYLQQVNFHKIKALVEKSK